MDILNSLNEVVYTAENGERKYTGREILDLAKGNLHYAESLLARADWQGIETLVEEDLREGEVVEFNKQYLITGGVEIEIIEV